MTPAESHRVAFSRCAAPLLIAALVSACSVAPVAPVANEPQGAAPARESPAPAAYPRPAPPASTTLPAEPQSGPPATDSGVRLPPLESAGLDEVLVVRDPLPI